MEPRFDELERKIGVVFRDKGLLKTACTHDSYVHEHPSEGLESNERLEFVGDAALRLVVSKHLYDTTKGSEGTLHDMRETFVTHSSAVKAAKSIELEKYLLFPPHQPQQLVSGKVLEDAYEALVGAVFVDRGYDIAADFLKRTLLR